MINKKIKILSLLPCLCFKSCDYKFVFTHTGEWERKDVMYLKNQGTRKKSCDPMGWIMLNGQKVEYKLDQQPGSEVFFLYYDIENDTEGDKFCRASASFTYSGNIRIKIYEDETGTYSPNTAWILTKIES